MQVFVDEAYTMIAAPVQCDVDGVPKGSHFARVPKPAEILRIHYPPAAEKVPVDLPPRFPDYDPSQLSAPADAR